MQFSFAMFQWHMQKTLRWLDFFSWLCHRPGPLAIVFEKPEKKFAEAIVL